MAVQAFAGVCTVLFFFGILEYTVTGQGRVGSCNDMQRHVLRCY